MLDLNKIKRQIEIIGLCIDNKSGLKPVDLAVMYDCEELTIKRDLQELRSAGIAIHSTKSKGICLDRTVETSEVKKLILQYVGLANSETSYDKATTLLVKKLKEGALLTIVTLQRCIENNYAAVIDYQKESNEQELGMKVFPLQIFQSDGYWRVLAMQEGRIKQYHITKLLSVRETQQKFKRPPQTQIDDMFRYSFRSWVGVETFNIKLQLSEPWISRLRPTQVFASQVITDRADGTVVLEATVNSLNEIASWIVSRGEGVKVLEPRELKSTVLEMAKGALANY